jgi:hypothetical protein
MSSKRRIESSRANGAKSRGPKTAAGKLRSSENSRRHGLLARTLVLEEEDAGSFAQLLAAFERDRAPRNEVERALVENMAAARWRLLRLWAIERATMQSEMKKQESETGAPADRAAAAFRALSDQSRALDLVHRYETRFDRQYARSLNLLLKLATQTQSHNRTVPPPPP